MHARENARCNPEERDFCIKFREGRRERNENDAMVVMVVVVSRYDVVEAG